MNFDNIKQKLNNHKPSVMGNIKCYSILIPLIMHNNEICLIYEKRANNISQAGEISFPGGEINIPIENPMQAASRETIEELGINTSDILNIFEFDNLYLPYNFLINTFVGILNKKSNINFNKQEVDYLIYVPLKFLLNKTPDHYINVLKIQMDEKFPFSKIPKGKDYDFRTGVYDTYFYDYNNHTIWGLTAYITKCFCDFLLKGE